MSKISVGGFSLGPTYSTLGDAVAISNPGDTIVLKKDLTINNTVYIDHDVMIDGNANNIIIPDGILGFGVVAGNISITNCSIVVGNNSNFISKNTVTPANLTLSKIEVGHHDFIPDHFYPSVYSGVTNQGDTELNFNLYINNCGIDYLYTGNVDTLVIENNSTIGDPATTQSSINATNIEISDSQLTNCWVQADNYQNVIKMNNVATIGGLIVNGNLYLNGFTVDSLSSYRNDDEWRSLIQQFQQNNQVFALGVTGNEQQMVDVSIEHLNLQPNLLNHHPDVYATTAWFAFYDCNVKLIDSHIPATLSAPNKSDNSKLVLENSSDDSQWNGNHSTTVNNQENDEQPTQTQTSDPVKESVPEEPEATEAPAPDKDHNAQIIMNGEHYDELSAAVEQADDGAVIDVAGQLVLDEGIIIKHDVKINGQPGAGLLISHKVAGFVVQSGTLTLANLLVTLGNQSNLIVDKELEQPTAIILDTVHVDRLNYEPANFYPVLFVGNNDSSQRVNASVTITNSILDKLYLFCNELDINSQSIVGTYFGIGGKSNSQLNAVQLKISDTQLNVLDLKNANDGKTIQLKNITIKSPVSVNGSADIDGLTVVPFDISAQEAQTRIATRDLFDEFNKIKTDKVVALVLGMKSFRTQIKLKHFQISDRDGLAQEKDLVNFSSWLKVINSDVQIIDSEIPATFTNKNTSNISQIDYDNTQDNSEWFRVKNAYDQLYQLVGLKAVKKELMLQIKNAKFNQKRIKSGLNVPRTAITIAFEGNSGTGKTTVAKALSAILVQEEILKDNFVSVPAQTLMTEHAGEWIDSAVNGILYVQDANRLVDNEGAVLFLLDQMEKHPNDLNVILSGNKDKLEDMFAKINPRFNSLFGTRIKFPDCSVDDLMEILQYKLKPAACTEPANQIVKAGLEKLLDANKITDNANFLKTIIDNLSAYQSERLSSAGGNISDHDLTIYNDQDAQQAIDHILVDHGMKANDQTNDEDALQELNGLIGLGSVKKQLKKFIDIASLNQMRKERGMTPQSTTMNMSFEGNPGTGKTVVARLFAKALFQNGVLKTDKLVEVKAKDLVAAYVGQTAKLTSKKVNEAINGVLFIDEAYSLAPKEGSFNDEAVDELIADMENNRDRLVVIMAGYPHDMEEFFKKSNPGLASRFPNKVDFPNYTQSELIEIFDLQLKHFTKDSNGKYVEQKVTPEAKQLVEDAIEKLYDADKIDSNARFIRDMIIGKISGVHSERIAEESQHGEITDENLNTFDESDVRTAMAQLLNSLGVNNDYGADQDSSTTDAPEDDAVEQLNSLIGLQSVKKEAARLINLAKMNEIKKANNLPVQSTSMNMVFEGNPGTGKTVVARLFAKALFQSGVLKTDKFVEAKAEDLIGQYTGQSAPKTKAVVMSALNGVLFIDEAYQLAPQPNGSGFNDEVVTELLTDIENNRDQLVVIMAGYTDEMEAFFKNGNPGLASRFPNRIIFPDYSAEELFEILQFNLKNKGLSCTDDALAILKMGIEHYSQTVAVSGNGRFIRNLVEKMIGFQADRLQTLFTQLNGISLTDEQKQQITTFNVEDAKNTLTEIKKDLNRG